MALRVQHTESSECIYKVNKKETSFFFLKIFSGIDTFILTVDRQEMGGRGGLDMQQRVVQPEFEPGSAAYVACALNHSTTCAPKRETSSPNSKHVLSISKYRNTII